MGALIACDDTAVATLGDIDDASFALPLIQSIDRGYGVVPIGDDGSVILQRGEVAVYQEDWKRSVGIVPGLWCIEHQRPVACSPHRDSWRIVTREVVYLRPSRRVAECWDTISLRSAVINGVRCFSVPDGPRNEPGLYDQLLGPIVGLYRPSMISAGAML